MDHLNNIIGWDNPIRKVHLEYKGTKSNAWSVQIDQNNNEWNEVGIVSNNYLLIENKQVFDIANDIADNSGQDWETNKVYWDGRRFMYSMIAKDTTSEVSVGDDVALGMQFWNSYDGSTALQFRLFLCRLVCLNGMMSHDVFKSLRFKHDQSSEGYEEQITEAIQIINGSQDQVRYITNALRKMDERELTFEELSMIRESYLNKLPTSLFGNIVDKLLTYRVQGKPNVYDLLNCSTNVLWHKKKSTKADFDHNAYVTDNLIKYINIER